jgi:hypothetical protein
MSNESELSDEERQRVLDEWAPIIDDPLAWQAAIDATGLGPNMRGSARFWTTVAWLDFPVISRDGAPDFSRIVLALNDDIGLELSTDETTPFIRYRFVPVAGEQV